MFADQGREYFFFVDALSDHPHAAIAFAFILDPAADQLLDSGKHQQNANKHADVQECFDLTQAIKE